MRKNSIFCTVGPSSLNKKFLKITQNKVNLLRLNLSHLSLKELVKNINFIRKYSKVPICIDTEGAQIRTKVKSNKFFKLNRTGKLEKYNKKGFSFYPFEIFDKIKVGDIFSIGFKGLKIKITKKNKLNLFFKVIKEGYLENNKGVHLNNRNIKINFLTNKDKEAIKISKKLNVKYFALSFTNSQKDIINFSKLLPNQIKVYKIETKKALNNFKELVKYGSNFLIDRGDLSQDITIEKIPLAQRKIIYIAKKYKDKNVYVATNFLESMIKTSYPTRAEANDIFNTLEMGASGLVLAEETAVGNYPIECVNFLRSIYSSFQKYKKNNYNL